MFRAACKFGLEEISFCYAGEMTGSLDQFVLIKASKSLGGVWIIVLGGTHGGVPMLPFITKKKIGRPRNAQTQPRTFGQATPVR
jgi:hypothetical protein